MQYRAENNDWWSMGKKTSQRKTKRRPTKKEVKEKAVEKITRRARRKRIIALTKGSATYEVLSIAVKGALLISAVGALLVAPGLAHGAKVFLRKSSAKEEREMKRHEILRAARRLEKQGLVRIISVDDGIRVESTSAGEKALHYARYKDVQLTISRKQWDGIWRVVLFDVPEKRRHVRDAIRRLLLHMGFFPLQKSALATPVPCKNVIEDIATLFEAEHAIVYLETDRLGHSEERATRFFGL